MAVLTFESLTRPYMLWKVVFILRCSARHYAGTALFVLEVSIWFFAGLKDLPTLAIKLFRIPKLWIF